jgi:hypothetical protein
MSWHGPHRAPAPQPTCRQRPAPTTTEPNSSALEISHASRLRRKLEAAGPGRRLVLAVWGVGYRLCDEPPVGPGA